MMLFTIDLLLFIIGSLGLIVGSITDFQKREVANWINFSLLSLAFIIRFLYSLLSSDWWFFLIALIWFIVILLFANFMYYAGQWGGGDSKMILGLSVLFATISLPFYNNYVDYISQIFNLSFSYNISFLIDFIFNIFIIGAIYSLFYTLYLISKNYKGFKKEFKKNIVKKNNLVLVSIGVVVFISVYIFMYFTGSFNLINQLILWFLLLIPLLFVYIKSIEKACMVRSMMIDELTEGEWVVEEVKKNHDLSFMDFYKSKFSSIVETELNQSFVYWIYSNFNFKKSAHKLRQKKYSAVKNKYNNFSKTIKKEIVSSLFWNFKFKLHAKYKNKSLKYFENQLFGIVEDKYLKDILKTKFNYTSKYELLCQSDNLGISLKQIEDIKLLNNSIPKNKQIKSVKVKVGIPFVPAFLLAFIFTIYLGNFILYFLGFYI